MMRPISILFAFTLAIVCQNGLAYALELKPYKDTLFAYSVIVGDASNPLDLLVDYQELRDINERDEVPERRVKGSYISRGLRKFEKDLKIETPNGSLATIATGIQDNAAFIIVYLHGQGGSRRQGSNDYTFGGNFNRVKNLSVLNGGLYLTPDFTDFGETGAEQVKAIISTFVAKSPNAKLVVACGSMGGFLCHRLARDADLSPNMAGMLFLGSFPDETFKTSRAFKAGMPVFIGHGSNDVTSAMAGMEAFADDLRKVGGQSQVMLHRFATGTHGTPVRMTDWRLVLNWMFKR